jgi:2-oxoglutarate ferredoxin oxidoreductase subunit gamma
MTPDETRTEETAAGTEVLLAGFGGQGILMAGKLLAHAAMELDLQVSWLPSYGPEMRGGTAHVIVCMSEHPIGSPYIDRPRALVVMNRPSMEKFAPKVREGGIIVVDRTMIDESVEVGRDDCMEVGVATRELAREAGSDRAANLVMLGAYVGASRVVPDDTVERAIRNEFSGRKEKFADASVAAFRAGLAVGREIGATA